MYDTIHSTALTTFRTKESKPILVQGKPPNNEKSLHAKEGNPDRLYKGATREESSRLRKGRNTLPTNTRQNYPATSNPADIGNICGAYESMNILIHQK